MDPTYVAAIIASTVSIWLPLLLASVKNPASKVKLKRAVGPLRIAAQQIVHFCDSVDALPDEPPVSIP